MRVDGIGWITITWEMIAFCVAMGGVVTVWLRKRSATVWPDVFGIVESASTYQDNFIWRTDIEYSYNVGADFYSGRFQLQSRSEKEAGLHEQRWSRQRIRIRHSPRDAKLSVVRMEDQIGLFPL